MCWMFGVTTKDPRSPSTATSQIPSTASSKDMQQTRAFPMAIFLMFIELCSVVWSGSAPPADWKPASTARRGRLFAASGGVGRLVCRRPRPAGRNGCGLARPVPQWADRGRLGDMPVGFGVAVAAVAVAVDHRDRLLGLDRLRHRGLALAAPEVLRYHCR